MAYRLSLQTVLLGGVAALFGATRVIPAHDSDGEQSQGMTRRISALMAVCFRKSRSRSMHFRARFGR